MAASLLDEVRPLIEGTSMRRLIPWRVAMRIFAGRGSPRLSDLPDKAQVCPVYVANPTSAP